MIVTAHQPEFMSYLGYFDKVAKADKLVVLDHVAYRKNYFQNRNQILGKDGKKWVTISVKKYSLGTPIYDIEINHETDWQKKMIASVKSSYSNAKFFDQYYSELEELLLYKDKYIADYNLRILDFYLKQLGICVEKVMSSDLGLVNKKDKMVVELCEKTNATMYVAGVSGKDYLDKSDFDKIGVELYHHDFVQKEYNQFNKEFVPYMSVLDILMHNGEKAKNFITSKLWK